MATVVTHVLFGAAAFSMVGHRRKGVVVGAGVAAALSALPDIDTFWFDHVAYIEPWGHRGMTHSLAAAAVLGGLAALALRNRVDVPGGAGALWAVFAAVVASHGVLDALTDGGEGVGFFLPFDDTRYWMPLRPIPVAPIGGSPFADRVRVVLSRELVLIWPLALAMWAARRSPGVLMKSVAAIALVVSACAWVALA